MIRERHEIALAVLAFLALVTASACPIPPPPFTPPVPGGGFVPPEVVCPAPIEAEDTSAATLVGDGSAASCTEEALVAAVATNNGAVAFDCGEDDVVIVLTAELVVAEDLVIDGGGSVTLDGDERTRIIRLDSSFELAGPRLVVQNLTFTRGAASGTDLEGGGAAIARTGGTLDVIGCDFVDNHGNLDGQDTQGGAIFSLGGGTTTITSSSFSGNSCSNGGALGALGSDLVVVNSVFDDNEATGNGGNPGNGGNGGSIYMDGDERALTLCGVGIRGSLANAFGGGVFRIGYQFTEPTNIDRTVVTGTIEDAEPSLGGGLYLQGTVVTMSASTVIDSTARGAGGAFIGPGSTVALTNVSFLDNTASSSLGGALFLSQTLGGDIVNATFAGNSAPGELAFGGAIVGDGGGVTLRNSLVLGSVAGNGFNPISCTTTLDDGSGSVQFPVERSGAGSDDPDALCAAGVQVADVALEEIDDDGVVPFRKPAADSIAVGLGTDCPPTDARGVVRTEPCTAGAVE